MQSIATMNLQRIESHAERTRALNDAAKRLVQKVIGCWQHDLSRPFSHRGRTYRVCVKCGMARDFNPENWKTLPQTHLAIEEGERRSWTD